MFSLADVNCQQFDWHCSQEVNRKECEHCQQLAEVNSKSIDQPAAADASLLPEDLVFKILSRVPNGSLCRYKCVSTSWLG
jgi:hypothetical protein